MPYLVIIFLPLLALFSTQSYAARAYEPIAIDSRIKTFIFSENEIFTLKFRIGYNAIIEFSKDEAIETISLGDPYPWKITPIERRLFMKPVEPGVKTNMTVITNKRVYLFEIESDVSSNVDSIDVVHVARFYYPTVNYDAVENSNLIPSQSKIQNIVEEKRTQNNIATVNILYSFGGKENKSTPLEIFDDRKRTFMRFNKNINYNDLKIYIAKGKVQKSPLPFKKTGDFIVIDGVYQKLAIEYQSNLTEVFNDAL